MTIVIFSNCRSVHTQRWVNGLRQMGLDVKLITYTQPDNAENNQYYFAPLSLRFPIPIIRHLLSLVDVVRFAIFLRPINFDIFHIHELSPFPYLLVPGFSGRNTMVTVWGSDVLIPDRNPLAAWLKRKILSSAKVITASSEYLAQATKKFSKKQIAIVPFGVDTDKFKPRPKSVSGSVVLGFAKNFKPVYGFAYLLDALTILKNKFPNIRLRATGRLDNFPEIRDAVRRSGLDNSIDFVGALPHDKMPEFFQSIDILVMPSLSESFGVTALEAAACGKPVIASRIGGIPEVVIVQQTGVLVPPANSEALSLAISSLLSNPRLGQKYGAAGCELVTNKFTWLHNLEQMKNLYIDLY